MKQSYNVNMQSKPHVIHLGGEPNTVEDEAREARFRDLVVEEMQARGWSMSELARRIGVSAQSVSYVLSGTNRVTYDFCMGIAGAFDWSPTDTLRMAGKLPDFDSDSEIARELFEKLSDVDREIILKLMYGMIQVQESNYRETIRLEIIPEEEIEPT